MLRWQQIALGQGLLNHFRHVVIGRGRQASRGFGRLTMTWKQACELGIAENTAERVDDVKAKSALGKGGAGNSFRLYRDQKSGLSTKP
jgi:hypothetical protein